MERQALMVILVPLLGSFLIPLFGWARQRKITGYLALAIIAVTNCMTWPLIGPALAGQTSSSIPKFFGHELAYRWIAFSMNVDALAVFMAFTASLIATLIALYSLGYIEHSEHEPEYYYVVTMFVGAMMGLVFSRNLIFIYMFWELSALACWRLIGYFRESEYIWKADKAFLITFAGAVLMLLGFALIFNQYGTLDISELRGKEIGTWALVLVMAGIFSKSATVPLHTWLPDAGVAPSTITSLLHAAILVKIGLYAFARLFCNGMVIQPKAQEWLLILALLSAFISASAALNETNIKRLLAYSTVSQIGYTFLGLIVFTHYGYIGALLYIMAHGFAKGGLFLCAGIIEHGTHTKDMTKMGGLFKKMPVTAVCYAICALSIAGIPPMAGFFSKYFVINGLVEGGHFAIATLAILTAVVTLLYMMKSFRMVFLGESRGEAHHEGSPVMVFVVAVLATLTVLTGFLLQLPYRLVNVADGQRVADAVSFLWR